MHLINFFFIAVILSSLYFKLDFAYLISLLVSVAAATFIYAQESLANILFTIAIFNLTPLVCRRFSFIRSRQQDSLAAQKKSQKTISERMLKAESAGKQSNSQLSNEASQLLELYKMTRDMSGALEFKDAFEILGKKMMELFRFQQCRLILLNEEAGAPEIEKVFELKYGHSQTQAVDTEEKDTRIIKKSLSRQKITYEEDSFVQAPLMADSKFLGTLAVKGLPVNAVDNFSILLNQFSLEFKRIRLYQRLQELAITDGLTGLFGRRHFLQRLIEEIGRSRRHNLRLAFLMLDIDRFKRCNDTFGHLMGDVVLKETARIIKANVRQIDLVARFGGEEFSVLLPDTDKIGASLVAERIRANVDKYQFRAYDETVKVEVSIGVAGFPEDAGALQELIDKSDRALYRAKQEGRNRVCVYG